MGNGPLPIGSTHARDYAPMREQLPLSSLTADESGFVRFKCSKCPRLEKAPLAKLRERFHPDAGLVNILNAILPTDCPNATPNASGIRSCGFHYRDLP
jgi:hypothetical protein